MERDDGSFTTCDAEVANDLNRYFELTFTQEDMSSVPVPSFGCEGSICDISISESVVLQKLYSLKDNKAPDPDGTHSYILKACADTLCTPLTMLYHQSLTSGDLPSDWKKAHVVPVFKKGSKCKASNYRPISLTSTVVKILESIIRSELLNFLVEYDILNHQQHGFMCSKSCLTNLLETFEDWTKAVDQGYGVDVIYLDYTKAFDSVPHCRLVSKLKAYGIHGNLLLWLTSFLSNRFQSVVVNGCHSD